MSVLRILPAMACLLLLAITTSSQTPGTGIDTAAVIVPPGTFARPVPQPIPVPPAVSNTTASPPARPEPSAKSRPSSSMVVDTTNRAAYNKAMAAYYQAIEHKNIADAKTFDSLGSYQVWALKNRQSVIQRQQITGTIIFILVNILVLSGLVFSAIQFRIALKGPKRRRKLAATTEADAGLQTSVSGFGIEVKSSILGVIILALSLMFFYLYLTNVYPLVSLDAPPVQKS